LNGHYEQTGRSFRAERVAGGWQLLTLQAFAPLLSRLHTDRQSTRLSQAALETLAIIAYRQPVGRAEIEEIRGVGAGAVLKTLQEREMVEVVGRGEGLGRPLLYGTTRRFLEHFGFRSLADLPRPEELPIVLRSAERSAAGV
jgi:segregation and condensation protein B